MSKYIPACIIYYRMLKRQRKIENTESEDSLSETEAVGEISLFVDLIHNYCDESPVGRPTPSPL